MSFHAQKKELFHQGGFLGQPSLNRGHQCKRSRSGAPALRSRLLDEAAGGCWRDIDILSAEHIGLRGRGDVGRWDVWAETKSRGTQQLRKRGAQRPAQDRLEHLLPDCG